MENKNQFNSELYQFLKKEYQIDKDKIRCIKLGMNRYGLDMKTVKDVVDFIADEVFKEEDTKAKEEALNNPTKPAKPTTVINWHKKFLPIAIILWLACFLLIGPLVKTHSRIYAYILGVTVVISGIFFVIGIRPVKEYLSTDYRFSFIEYFKSRLMWKLLALVSVDMFIYQFIKKTTEIGLMAFLIANVIAIITILVQWAKASGSVFHTDTGEIRYTYDEPYRKEGYNADDVRGETTQYYTFTLKRIETLTVTPFSIIIYGIIEKSSFIADTNKFGRCTINKLKVPKMFKKQRELIERLQPKYNKK